MEKQEKYLAPEVEVLEVIVEKGFAATGGGTGGSEDMPTDDEWI